MSRDCPRHTGVVAEEARSKCQVCMSAQFIRMTALHHALRRFFLGLAIGVAFCVLVAVFAGCAHVQRRTIEATSTSTATVQAETKSSATVTTTATHDAKRVIRKSRITRPLPDGGSETIDEVVELMTSDGRVNTESAAAVKVEAKAATEDKSKVDDLKKEPPSMWDSVKLWLVVIVVLVIGVGVTMAWRKLKWARG
jgi:hypothetical protein